MYEEEKDGEDFGFDIEEPSEESLNLEEEDLDLEDPDDHFH